MRNLKRALSLALASVMLLGMMVVGTSASYTDVSSKNNQEAIEVLQAVGVMVGDENGNFNPDQKVTRNEMAVIMANLLDLKVKDFDASSIKFTDVPAWAAPYVAACYADGIIAGYSETTFGGSDTVTAAQAALMLQKALGYFQFQADFGDDWQLATVRNGSKIDLFDGVDAGAKTALTRNEVAQMVLNALEADIVYYSGSQGTNIALPDGTSILTGYTIQYWSEGETKGYDYTTAAGNDDNYLQLCEDLFGKDLKKSPTHDDLGRPGTKWTYKTKEVGKYASEADYVIVLDDDYSQKTDALKVIRDLTDNDDLKYNYNEAGKQITNLYINGANKNGNAAAAAAAAVYGNVVELYCDGDVIEDVVALTYKIGKIEKVSTKLTTEQKEDGATAKLSISGVAGTVLDNEIAGYDAATYVKDAYVLYVWNDAKSDGEDVILASQIAKTIEGKATAVKGSKALIDGTYYKDLTGKIAINDEGTFYLNLAGQIVVADTSAAKSTDYAYIYKMDVKSKELNDDGIVATTAKAYVVLNDGNKASYTVAIDDVTKDETDGLKRAEGVYFKDTKVKIDKSYTGVIAYSVNSDGKLVYETAKYDPVKQTLSIDKTAAAGTDSNTQFIFTYPDGSTQKVSVVTGYKNVKITSTSVWTISNDDGDVLYVFVPVKNGTVLSDANLAVILDNEAVEGKDGDDKTFTYSVALDGKDDGYTLTFKSAQSFTKGQVIDYKMNGKWAEVVASSDTTLVTNAKVTAANDDYIYAGKQFNLTGNEEIYTITMIMKDGKVDSVAVDEGGKIEKYDTDDLGNVLTGYISYTTDNGDLDVVYVYEWVY